MSPSPEYYLNALREFNSPSEAEHIQQWERARCKSNSHLFSCHVRLGEEGGSLLLGGLIQPHWNYLGFGQLLIPTFRVDSSTKAASILPRISNEIDLNKKYIGDGNPFVISKLLDTNIPMQGSDLVLNSDRLTLSTDSTNQHTATLTGVNIERDPFYAKGNKTWRTLPYLASPDFTKYLITSARGFVDYIHAQIPLIKISPSSASPLERKF